MYIVVNIILKSVYVIVCLEDMIVSRISLCN